MAAGCGDIRHFGVVLLRLRGPSLYPHYRVRPRKPEYSSQATIAIREG